MAAGRTIRLLDIDLSARSYDILDIPAGTRGFLGGRGLNVKRIFDDLDPRTAPFDEDNRLCIAPGALTGTPAPCSARTTISSLSPRGLLDSSSIGGFIGSEIRFAGYDQVVIRGRSPEPVYLFITNEGVAFCDAAPLWGRDPWETQEAIRAEQRDRDIQSMAIGVAGENRVHFAAVLTGRLTSVAGRCGLGAVMGAKRLKAVAARGRGGIALADPQGYLTACRDMREAMKTVPAYAARHNCASDKTLYERYIKDSGKFVAGNWEPSDWRRDGFHDLLADPEAYWRNHAQHLKRAGARRPGCFGCPLYHETFFHIPALDDIGSTKCSEWLSWSGTVWITDRDRVLHASHLCNRWGLDSVSAAGCIGFLMELHQRGVITAAETDGIAMARGSLPAIAAALEKIAAQQGFGRWFQRGVAHAADELGGPAREAAMHSRGQELFPIELRAYKSVALLAAVGKPEQYDPLDFAWALDAAGTEAAAAERFGDHRTAVPTDYNGKARLVVDSENRHCVTDLLGVCKYMIPWGFGLDLSAAADLLQRATGRDVDQPGLMATGARVILLERAFNVLRGLTRMDERPPRRLFETPVPDGLFKGEVLDPARFDAMLDEYYHLRGCDGDGRPTRAAFEQLGMTAEWETFRERHGEER